MDLQPIFRAEIKSFRLHYQTHPDSLPFTPRERMCMEKTIHHSYIDAFMLFDDQNAIELYNSWLEFKYIIRFLASNAGYL